MRRESADAEQVLSAWTALWHPALVAAAGKLPGWVRAQDPPSDPTGCLITVPHASESQVPSGWLDSVSRTTACVLMGLKHRHELIAAALAMLDDAPPPLDAGAVADFLALGFAHLQVELLTRQLRYMSNLDELSFERELVAAARDTLAGQQEPARRHLQRCFDLLHESREYFYPIDAHLVDFTLVAPGTTGAPFRAELAQRSHTNLLMAGEVVERLAETEPDSLEALREAMAAGRVDILGGEYRESHLPLLSPEAIRHRLLRGIAAYERHLGRRPTVFGRRRFGLSPLLPQILVKLGFPYACHFTLDAGKFPSGNQSRIRWQSPGQETVEALARIPLDASQATTFLALPETLGHVLDLDHVATAVLAHWPGQSSAWYEDLQRASALSTVIGKFIGIDEYFHQTELAGQVHEYGADEYRSPWLRRAVAEEQADPISRWVRYRAFRAELEALERIRTLVVLLTARVPAEDRLGPLAEAVESIPDETVVDEASLAERLQAERRNLLPQWVDAVTAGGQPVESGYLLANPHGFAHTACAVVPELAGTVGTTESVRLTDRAAGAVVAEVPSMGFAWVGSGPEAEEPPQRTGWFSSKKTAPPPLAEGCLLRSDYFEVKLDPVTGAIYSVHDFRTRGNRLGQQLALRIPRTRRRSDDPEDFEEDYTIMAADEIAVSEQTPLSGAITCRGRLVDRKGEVAAHFSQTTRVRRASRVIELDIEIQPHRLPTGNPWDAYYASRLAWNDSAADLVRGVQMVAMPTDAQRFEAPDYVDIQGEAAIRGTKTRTTLLTGGLPFHRRLGLRMLDTLLMVHGERARRFRLGIGIDLPYPMQAATEFVAPQWLARTGVRPRVDSAWLFHMNARNVLATAWEPHVVEGQVKGFVVRLLEVEGRPADVILQAFRPIGSGLKNNGPKQPATLVPVDRERLKFSVRPHEWIEITAEWAT